jgi:hypothetical protein
MSERANPSNQGDQDNDHDEVASHSDEEEIPAYEIVQPANEATPVVSAASSAVNPIAPIPPSVIRPLARAETNIVLRRATSRCVNVCILYFDCDSVFKCQAHQFDSLD